MYACLFVCMSVSISVCMSLHQDILVDIDHIASCPLTILFVILGKSLVDSNDYYSVKLVVKQTSNYPRQISFRYSRSNPGNN